MYHPLSESSALKAYKKAYSRKVIHAGPQNLSENPLHYLSESFNTTFLQLIAANPEPEPRKMEIV